MKKIYLTLFTFALAASVGFSQSNYPVEYTGKKDKSNDSFIITKDYVVKPASTPSVQLNPEIVIFEDDFSDPNTWVISQNPAAFQVTWQIGTDLETSGGAPLETINSTSLDNGYAMVDSDVMVNPGIIEEDTWLTMANPVDLTDFDKVVVQFETMYRSWTDETAFVVVSNDPDVWPTLTQFTDADSIVGVYKAFPNLPHGSQSNPTNNPTLIQINISDYAANQSQIWVRFSFNGIWGYAWFIDDFKIIEQPANDMKMLRSRLSHNGFIDINDSINYKLREEYARIPASEVSEFHMGVESFNFGFETQTNVVTELTVDDDEGNFVFGMMGSVLSLANNDTIFSEDVTTISLENGYYTVTAVVTSDQESGGDDFENNTIIRGLEISPYYYALDGIGVHPEAQVGSITAGGDLEGDPEDGYRVMVHYDIKNELEIFGLEVLLHQTRTVPGGFVIATILDSTEALDQIFDSPLAESEEVEITQEDIDAGYKRIYFDEPVTLEGVAVFASIEMFVSIDVDNDSPISILDDRTVIQPDLSSVIYVPEDNVFPNGNAGAIRLMLDILDGIEELEVDVAVLHQNVPNPAIELTRIDFELLSPQKVTVMVTDLLGKVVSNENLGNLQQGTHQYILDVSNLNAGIYQYTILTENGKLTKSMSVIK
jgi:hypothetical protein